MTVMTTATPRSPSSHFRRVCKEKSHQAAAAKGPRPVPPAPSRSARAPLSRTHLHGAMERRCEAAGGAGRLLWAQGARRGEGRGGEQRACLGALRSCRRPRHRARSKAGRLGDGGRGWLPLAGSEQRQALGAERDHVFPAGSVASRGFSELWFRLRFKRCERGNKAVRWRGRTLDTERISVGKQIMPERRSQK